mmetsp:Transcript_11245/g.22265  ORF Transcript_11245/g.22265 Transcript_11245/m.22265 type:complete len:821 (+) Transcript_11245:92-2554(+)
MSAKQQRRASKAGEEPAKKSPPPQEEPSKPPATNTVHNVLNEVVMTFRERPGIAILMTVLCIFYAAIITGYYASHHNMTRRLVEMQVEQQKLRKLNAEIVAGTYQCKADSESMMPEEGPGRPYLTVGVVLSGLVLMGKFMMSEAYLARRKMEEYKMPFTVTDFVSYRLDFYFSKSKWAKPLLLLGVTFFLILIGAVGLAIANGGNLSASVWESWTYVADPGTHADTEGSMVRLVSFSITIGGMLVFALMIGIISESIGERVDELKKGKSRVIESGHTLMLGWNDKSLAIIQQIALANESEGGGCVVVLSENEKEEMEETLKSAVESLQGGLNLLGTTVIFRSGNPLNEHEIMKVSIHSARAIICLSTDVDNADDADSRMVRQVLSLKGIFENGSEAPVVVELADVDNKELVKLIAPDMCEVIVAHDIIGRLMIQCARQPGLAYVLENLMGFDGDEFYIQNWPELEGLSFDDITCRFDDAVPIGIKSTDGHIKINPGHDYVIRREDEVLVLAEDNDSYSVNDGTFKSTAKPIAKKDDVKVEKEKMLFCGWRRDMYDMIMELDQYVAPGSALWLLNTVPADKRSEMLKDKGNKGDLQLTNLEIKNAVGNPIVRRDLQKLVAIDDNGKETGDVVTLEQFDSLLILADDLAIERGADMQSSDSRSLASLLIIQDIQKSLVKQRFEETGELVQACDPISEILDTRTRSLLRVVDCKGYVMSNQIVSAVISQVAECRDMNVVLGELLSAEGNEPYLKPAGNYTTHDGEVASFWDLALRARSRDEIAIGYKPVDLAWDDCVSVLLNPPDKRATRKWVAGDIVVIIAQ